MNLIEPPQRKVSVGELVALGHEVSYTLPLPEGCATQLTLAQSLRRRHSSSGTKHAGVDKLGALLWLCCRAREDSSRPYPSPGGLYSVELLVQGLHGHDDLFRYDARTHELLALTAAEEAAGRLHQLAASCLPNGGGTNLWLVANQRRLASRYHSEESLLWREAGVLTGYLSLAAQSVDLHVTAMGVTGEPVVSSLQWSSPAFGLGGVALWDRASTS